jgi:hypothetical protein
MRLPFLFERTVSCLLAGSLLIISVTLSRAEESAAIAGPYALTSVAPDQPLTGDADTRAASAAHTETPAEPPSQNVGEGDVTRFDEPKDDKAPTRLERARAALALSNAPVLSDNEVCISLVDVARANALPVGFFTNLIWRESKFDHEAISRAGAMGIAQFMPDVAEKLGLDAFDARDALTASGRLLRGLVSRFNNLGLVAAAYNAGPKRVFEWLRQRTTLPKETRDYVSIVTGRPVEKWLGLKSRAVVFNIPRKVPCHQSAAFSAVEEAERAVLLRKAAEEQKLIEQEREAARLQKKQEREAAHLQKNKKRAVATLSRTKPRAVARTASPSHAASLRGGDKRLFIKRNLRSA